MLLETFVLDVDYDLGIRKGVEVAHNLEGGTMVGLTIGGPDYNGQPLAPRNVVINRAALLQALGVEQ